jgi:lysozyme
VHSTWRASASDERPDSILLVLDFERNGHYPGGTMRVDQAITFINRIKQRTGVYPGLYTNEHRLRSVLNSPRVTPAQREVLRRCWLWVANYGAIPGSMRPWSRWEMWQYTGDGKCRLPRRLYPIRIANIPRAERNMFRGTRAELRLFWHQNGWNPALAQDE